MTVRLNFVDFAATVPVLLDLVEYSVVSGLAPDDYDKLPLAFRAFDISHTNAGGDISIDVTELMREAQFQELADFQVRFLLAL